MIFIGVSYEMNWYLVIDEKSQIKLRSESEEIYFTIKDEKRIYPIGGMIPLISKKEGFIDIVDIKSFSVFEDRTVINFKYKHKHVSEEIKQHYYDLYLDMKK